MELLEQINAIKFKIGVRYSPGVVLNFPFDCFVHQHTFLEIIFVKDLLRFTTFDYSEEFNGVHCFLSLDIYGRELM